jgi:hypothetical protein
MNRRLPLLLVLAAAVLAAGCSRGKKLEAAKTEAKRPDTEFMHAVHVDQDIACLDCHVGLDKATSLRERHLPNAEKCAECHDDKREGPKPASIPPARLSFSHAAHLPQISGKETKDKCTHCHKKLPEMGEPRFVPAMDTCTGCHKHQLDYNQGRCRPCHVDMQGLEPGKYFTHAGDWIRLHGPLARPSAESCAQCHDQTYCSECHAATTTAARPSIVFPERVERGYIHRGDYVSRHMVDAQANPASCQRCHGPKFCEACHEQQNLKGVLLSGGRDPHPAGWMNQASGEFHGDAARRNASACAACHDQAGSQNACVQCHRDLPGVQNSPHPSSWKARHDADDIGKNAMCRACHVSGGIQ